MVFYESMLLLTCMYSSKYLESIIYTSCYAGCAFGKVRNQFSGNLKKHCISLTSISLFCAEQQIKTGNFKAHLPVEMLMSMRFILVLPSEELNLCLQAILYSLLAEHLIFGSQ